ncbi:gliding-motility protein MglA [Nannocystis pusilla]|uniref:Gliding-motility protein MglA n=1 Tax=Nannocystis pusilla TaxID=889268 RepID=A0A9X3EUB9_9BACT|nr:gliding-motility protein MglA [Nannocystis pusilla]MCY1009564.1 gliding-motility protein MglA [Nannocystis pusilla]
MASIDHEARRIYAKIVYWGPPAAGKWANLEEVHRRTSPPDRPPAAKETSVGFPLALGELRGYATVFALLRCPSDGAWTRHVFDELGSGPPDGVVFIADSSPTALLDNVAWVQKLNTEVSARGLDLGKLPAVFQYNKRDVAGALPVEQLRRAINPWQHPDGEAIAARGIGVFETLKQVSRGVLEELRKAP